MLFYLLERGESERREGGWETPRGGPPPLLRVRRPGDLLSTKYGPRAPEVRLGLPDHAKTSDTCEKVRLGRFGSAKVLQSAQDATLRFGPLRIAKNVVHVCQNAKATFCNFFIFENFSKIFTFWQMRFGVYFTDVF